MPFDHPSRPTIKIPGIEIMVRTGTVHPPLQYSAGGWQEFNLANKMDTTMMSKTLLKETAQADEMVVTIKAHKDEELGG